MTLNPVPRCQDPSACQARELQGGCKSGAHSSGWVGGHRATARDPRSTGKPSPKNLWAGAGLCTCPSPLLGRPKHQPPTPNYGNCGGAGVARRAGARRLQEGAQRPRKIRWRRPWDRNGSQETGRPTAQAHPTGVRRKWRRERVPRPALRCRLGTDKAPAAGEQRL